MRTESRLRIAEPSFRLAWRGFTLVEILLVIALMGVVLTIGIPSVFHAVRKTPIRQAVADLQDGCRAARMMAILQGKPAELVINSQDNSLKVQLVTEVNSPTERDQGADLSLEGTPEMSAEPLPAHVTGFTAHLPDSVAFKKLLVNLRDMMEYDEARVHFYPNGTCDAFAATLLSEQNEERTIMLEVTTGRDYVEGAR